MTIFSPSDSAKKLERMEDGENGTSRPFDISDLSSIPEPENGDPPYRDWWVVEEEQANRARRPEPPNVRARCAAPHQFFGEDCP